MLHTEHNPRAGAARGTPQRQGIALVTVLGMLCLLVVLAVSFAIAMRTERIAGRSYTDTVRVRQLTHAGLARAIGAIDATNQFYLGSPLYTPGGGAPLFSGSVTNYIPLGALGTNSAVTNLIGWTTVVTYPTSIGSTTGRIAYLVVDCSGFLDANYSGGSNWVNGTDASELKLNSTVLPDSANLLTARSTAKRFQSVAELKQALGQPSRNFVTYSAYPPFYRSMLSNDLIMLDVPYATLSSAAYQTKITTTLQQCGLSALQAGGAYSNLLAYTDTTTDVPPGGPDNFYTKSVPMLNEVVVYNEVTGVIGNWTHKTYVYYETFYPFPVPALGSYQVMVTNLPVITPTTPPDLKPWSQPPAVSSPPAFTPTIKYKSHLFTYTQTSTSSNMLSSLTTTATVQLAEAWVKNAGGAIVDHMPAGTHALTVDTSETGFQGLGVYDPRINWRPSDWVWEEWWNTSLEMDNVPNDYFNWPDEGIRMFARTPATGGTISNAAELGFLLYDKDKPWHTIKIIDNSDPNYPMHPVLDYFGTSVQTNDTRAGVNSKRPGVNVNSQNTNALATAFVNAPINRYPGGPSIGTVSAADAQLIAAQLIARTGAHGTNSLSVVGRALNNNTVAFTSLWDDCDRESIVANSYRLLSPRQNLFTILIAAQVTGSSGGVLAEQRAVAVVWRDPYPDANGRHPALVRFFKWLME